MPVTPADDQRHEAPDNTPDWCESWSFYFIEPRHQLCCYLRLRLLPNRFACGIAVSMSRAGKPIYHRQLDGLGLPAGDLLSGIGAAGLSFRALSLSRGRYLLGYQDPVARLAIDLDWQGLHEPADPIGMHVPSGMARPPEMRVEQMGRVAGRMAWRDSTVDLLGMGPREHSIGARGWESTAWYDVTWAMMDDGRAFGLSQFQRGALLQQQPWMWDREKLLPLYGMRYEKVLDAEDRPSSVEVHFSDPMRRRYLLSGKRRTSSPCFADHTVVHAAYFDFALDDGTRGIGAQEYGYRMGEVH